MEIQKIYPVTQYMLLGRCGDNNVKQIWINVRQWLQEVPSGQFQLMIYPPQGDVYPAPTVLEDGILKWTITDADTAIVGDGQAQLTMYGADGEVARQRTIGTRVLESKAGRESGEIPDHITPWVDTISTMSTQAKRAAAQVKASQSIVQEYSQQAQAAVGDAVAAKNSAEASKVAAESARDSAQNYAAEAQAAKVSAQAAASDAQDAKYAAQSAKTLAEGAKSQAIGAKLEAEYAQQHSVAAKDAAIQAQISAQGYATTAQTAASSANTANSQAQSAKTDAVQAKQAAQEALQQLKDGIRTGDFKGEKGDTPVITSERSGNVTTIRSDGVAVAQILDGQDGDAGFSPSVSVTKNNKVTTIRITDKDGVHTATINDGEDGSDATVTKQSIEAALSYVPANDATAMIYKQVIFDGTKFTDDAGTQLTFSQLKTLCLDHKHFVYCTYENDLYIPQHIQSTQIYFDATYIRNHQVEIHRVGININGSVNQQVVYPQEKLVSGTNIKTINNESILGSGDIHIDGGGDIVQNPNDEYEGIVMPGTLADVDPTLTIRGYAADAGVVGQRIGQIDNTITDHEERITDVEKRIATIEDLDGLHRYGVTGIGIANTQLTRLYDAVGMTAQVGTDGDNSNVINDFDDVAPFNRKKCVGEWRMYEGKPVFHINAYLGDPDYTEDGSMGDYVAVDCTPAYYMYDKDNGTLVISAHHYEGYRPFDCLMDRTTEECRPHTYLPCYALAVKDGHAVSLPGLHNEQGDYKKLFDTCKTAANNAAVQAILMPVSVNFYDWALFTVEFATTNCQSVMQGCTSLRHSNDDRIIMSSATEGIIQNYYAARVVGEYVSIQPTTVDINAVAYLASHRITSIERCNQDGTPNASGTYQHVTFEVLDETRTIEAGATYRFAARPYNTGDCNGVSTPSGSPVSNTNGYYPMKYRWRENVYGNQYQTVSDLMNFAVVEEGFANVNANYAAHLEWFYHRNPETLTPTNYANSTAGRDAMIAAGWELLDVTTPAENYINGYIKSIDYSHKYPDVWKPGVTVGASASTYYADYAFLVNSSLLRAVRLGGYWSSGAYAGFSFAFAHSAPSNGYAFFGGGLYYPQ